MRNSGGGSVLSRYSSSACLAWLASAGLSPEMTRVLLQTAGSPESLYELWMSSESLSEIPAIPGAMGRILKQNGASGQMEAWEKLIEKHQIRTVIFSDPLYPSKLLNIQDAPAVLFFQGDLNALDGELVSVVGSRNATLKGLEATKKITRELSSAGIGTVSGLAYGIDAAAHGGCLLGNAPTTAVLGCGLDQNYPAENEKLRKQIVDRGGLVLSEYAPGDKPLGWHFPYRNRIISALGDCLILMEARLRSGSLTSVQHALNQGKTVFVYPGEPDNPKYEGNHQLLREGAVYFTTSDDLMEDMGWLDKMQIMGQNNRSAVSDRSVQLSSAEQKVYDRLEMGDQSFDQLCDALNMSAAMLNATLSMLQIQGLIAPLPGKLYTRVSTP